MKEDVGSGSALVPGYAGHADAVARRLSDAQVRSWVGEKLTDLAERLDLGEVRERADALLMRCEFADQQVVHAIEDERFGQPALAELVEGYDRKLIEATAGCAAATAEAMPAVIAALEAAFDERAEAIADALKG
jgi:hypothetical protein